MPNSQKLLDINELQPGDRARIAGYHSGLNAYRQQLLAMGLTPNTEITVVRRAPLGDPIQIQVRQFELCLRQAEAQILKLVPVE